ncbi:MAG: DUF4367 domain-containing protein [Oscillospiraceae bacterium]|nr:DUF4367 domain-containing protein [Oscillospiraceae bacterium]
MDSFDFFDIIAETPERYVLDAANAQEKAAPVCKSYKKIWLIAAIIALMVFLMGAAITGLVSMNVEKVKVNVQNGGNQETSGHPREGERVNFDEVHDVFIELGSYYPQEIPDGYTMTFVSDPAAQQDQIIRYENAAGDWLTYRIYAAAPASAVEVYGIEKKTEVTINGCAGILYEQTGGSRTLVWADEKNGYGFSLRADDPSVDLIAMAKSTAEGEPLTPTNAEQKEKAIEQLGNYSPTYLPAGFEEQGVQASPLEDGGDWYSYVRKWYVNKAENTQIYFEYETYRIVTEDGFSYDAKTVCSFHIPGYEFQPVGEEVEINGLFGIATNCCDIAWADPERHVLYHLHSEDVMGDELLRVAQSICEND